MPPLTSLATPSRLRQRAGRPQGEKLKILYLQSGSLCLTGCAGTRWGREGRFEKERNRVEVRFSASLLVACRRTAMPTQLSTSYAQYLQLLSLLHTRKLLQSSRRVRQIRRVRRVNPPNQEKACLPPLYTAAALSRSHVTIPIQRGLQLLSAAYPCPQLPWGGRTPEHHFSSVTFPMKSGRSFFIGPRRMKSEK